jgi:hypothetical protein
LGRKNFKVASLGSEWQKNGAHEADTLYFVSPISYSIPDPSGMQRLKCNISKQTSSKQHVLALACCLACVTDLVGGSSLDAVKTSPKKAC